MKKKTASNPLKFFNDNKAKAYKRGGDVMKAFKKSLPKAQDGETFKNRAEALRTLDNTGSRDSYLKDIKKEEANILKNKEFYNSLPPVEAGQQRAAYNPTTFYVDRAKQQLKLRDDAEQYLRNKDIQNPIGTLKTKPATPIQKKGGVVKKKKK